MASILLRQVKRQVGPDKEDTQKRGSVNRLQLETGRIVKRRLRPSGPRMRLFRIGLRKSISIILDYRQ